MRFYRPWALMRLIYPEAFFRGDTKGRKLYLTIDDGPNPDSTEKVLQLLDAYNIKGVFFCMGKAVEKYPHLFAHIIEKGHLTGNHGYSHLNGWKTGTAGYLQNISRASESIDSCLFRPPYGRIRINQYREVIRDYKVFFWDLMSYDFEKKSDNQRLLMKLIGKMRSGSVIVFHDSPAALSSNLLGDFIREALARDYSFELPVLSREPNI